HILYSFREVGGFFWVKGIGTTKGHITKGAPASTNITHNHKGGCAVAKAFWEVGASGFFTDRMQLLLAQHVFYFLNFPASGYAYSYPVGLAQGGVFVHEGDGTHFALATEFLTDGNFTA